VKVKIFIISSENKDLGEFSKFKDYLLHTSFLANKSQSFLDILSKQKYELLRKVINEANKQLLKYEIKATAGGILPLFNILIHFYAYKQVKEELFIAYGINEKDVENYKKTNYITSNATITGTIVKEGVSNIAQTGTAVAGGFAVLRTVLTEVLPRTITFAGGTVLLVASPLIGAAAEGIISFKKAKKLLNDCEQTAQDKYTKLIKNLIDEWKSNVNLKNACIQ